jgi:dTDP-4-dehydrorhamnose reductase
VDTKSCHLFAKKYDVPVPTVTVIGSDGMLGQVLSRVLSDKGHDVYEVNRRGIGSIPSSKCLRFDPLEMDVEILKGVIGGSNFVVNCLGVIKQRIDERSIQSVEEAFLVNSVFSRHLVLLCEELSTKLISIGTDCVFAGDQSDYSEVDTHDAKDVYGISKSAGELVSYNHSLIRTSFIGLNDRYHREFLDWVLHQPAGARVKGFKNHWWNGLTTLQVSRVLNGMIQENYSPEGVFHLVPEGKVSKAEMIRLISQMFHRRDLEIEEVNAENSVNRTLSTVKPEQVRHLWEVAGYKYVPDFRQMLDELALWSLDSGHNDNR